MLEPLRAISWKGWIALGLYLVAFGLLSRGGWARDQWLVGIAVVLLVGAAALLQMALNDAPERGRLRIPLQLDGAIALDHEHKTEEHQSVSPATRCAPGARRVMRAIQNGSRRHIPAAVCRRLWRTG